MPRTDRALVVIPNSDRLIERTREVFEPKAGHPLSDEDCREIHRNLSGFFSILAEWKAKADGRRAGTGPQPIEDAADAPDQLTYSQELAS
jgi:hypothetical protein